MVNFEQLYTVEEGITIDDATGIISGADDPTVVAPGTTIPESTLYIQTGANSLFQKTGPLDTDWTVFGAVFGNNYAYTEDLVVSTTTSTTFQTKETLTVSGIPAGTFRFGWSFLWNHNATTNDFEGRVILDGNTGSPLSFMKIEPKDSAGTFGSTGTSQRRPTSGFVHLPLTAGTHTFTIEYRTDSGGTQSSIWDTRLEFWRVQ